MYVYVNVANWIVRNLDGKPKIGVGGLYRRREWLVLRKNP